MIKIDIEMPDQCTLCPCYDEKHDLCKAQKKYLDWEYAESLKYKPKWCPLIDVEDRRKTDCGIFWYLSPMLEQADERKAEE